MACDTGFEEWTFDLVLDRNPVIVDSRLVFCLQFFPDRRIEGKVFKSDGTFLSNLSGRNQPFVHVAPGAGVTLMSVDFLMSPVLVTISGVKLGRRFEGRLRASTTVALAAALPSGSLPTAVALAPADGDTGTATGTQT